MTKFYRYSACFIAIAALIAACGNAAETPESTPASGEASVAAPSADAAPETPSGAPPDPAKRPETAPSADGRRAFSACAACHAVTDPTVQKPRRKVGPNLWNIVDAPAGADENFKYSAALLESGVTWDAETLDAFLANPRAVIPGNRMSYAGEQRAPRRAAIIAYLQTKRPAAEASPDSGN